MDIKKWFYKKKCRERCLYFYKDILEFIYNFDEYLILIYM